MPTAPRLDPPALHRVYGVTLSSDARLDVPLPAGEPPVELAIEVREARRGEDDVVGGLTPVHTEGRGPNGLPALAFYETAGGAVVRITRAIDFHLTDDRIVARVTDPRHAYVLEIALFGLIMSLWLELRGRLTLHASTVVVGGSAVAFAGRRGGGKSSAAATMVGMGYPLLADDLLAVDVTAEGAIAHAGYPQIRMWPDQAEHFTGTRDHPRFHPGHDKRRVVVGDGFGSFEAEPMPLRRIYLLRRADTADAAVAITPLPPRHGMFALLQHSFLVPEMARFRLQEGRLARLAQMLRTTEVCELSVPNGLDQLPRIADAIEEDLAALR